MSTTFKDTHHTAINDRDFARLSSFIHSGGTEALRMFLAALPLDSPGIIHLDKIALEVIRKCG